MGPKKKQKTNRNCEERSVSGPDQSSFNFTTPSNTYSYVRKHWKNFKMECDTQRKRERQKMEAASASINDHRHTEMQTHNFPVDGRTVGCITWAWDMTEWKSVLLSLASAAASMAMALSASFVVNLLEYIHRLCKLHFWWDSDNNRKHLCMLHGYEYALRHPPHSLSVSLYSHGRGWWWCLFSGYFHTIEDTWTEEKWRSNGV